MGGLFRKYRREAFDESHCTRCGLCLSGCPMMHLPEEEAKREIAALIRCLKEPETAHKSTQAVLRTCTSCFACNLICPEDCSPVNLFFDLWYQAYKRQGLPERARYFLPHSKPNFRTYVLERQSEAEKAAVESWASLEAAEEIFYPGCNLIAAPYLTFSKLFAERPIRGALEYCCGEMYFRMGAQDQVEEVARKCTAYFRRLGAKKVYLQCTAGLNMFTNVLPQFGADFNGIEFCSFVKLLYGQLVSGELKVRRRFDGKTVAVQDSCHAKIYEEGYRDWPRKILELLGFTVLEAPKHGDSALCCGIGSGFSHGAAYAKRDLIAGQRACAKNLHRAKADYVAVYCSGCLEMLAVSRYVAHLGSPVYHLLELIQEAIGETPQRKHRSTAFHFLLGTLRNQGGGKGYFYPPPIE